MPTASRTSSPKPKAKESQNSRAQDEVAEENKADQKVKLQQRIPQRPARLRSSLLTLYGTLAIVVILFGVLSEWMRHHIPLHQFRHRDGSLIDISSFDPVELGPFPKCHEHFGEHLGANGTWVKNSEVSSGGPFLPGHPQNPEWLEKVSKDLLKEQFTWKGLQASLHMMMLASVCMFAACKHSVWTFTEPVATRSAMHVLEQEDAYWLPIIGSGSLLSLFLVLKYLSIDWIKQLLQLCIVGSCALGAAENVEEFWKVLSASQEKTGAKQAGSSTPTSGTIRAIVKCTVGLALVVSYVMTKHWILNNIMGLSFCLLGIRYINLSSFRTGVVLLAGLFVYDVFWVFFSKPLFGSNVMAPMKLMLPRDFGGCGEFKFSMLGLGDIAVPGMFCALLAKWDAVKMAQGCSNGFVYLNVLLLMYILSLATTIAVMVVFNHAQPALLYICPYLLIGSVAVAIARGEFVQLLAYSLPSESNVEGPGKPKREGDESKKSS
eukprot:symbB.v1.2.025128.t1/scaffold2423.1/size79540/3